MNEFIEFLLNVAFCYFVFRIIMALLEKYVMFQIMKAVRQELGQNKPVQEEISDIMTLNVERIDEQYFCYDEVTNEFVCQGKNIPELTERFKLRYPGMQAALASDDEATIVALSKEPEVKGMV